MNGLELRYRLLLRAYPAGYLREREEEMVATFLEFAAAGDTGLSLRDVWDAVRHGLGLRLAAWDRHADVAWRHGVWISLMGWLLYAGFVQLGVMVSGAKTQSWWYVNMLDWAEAIAGLVVVLLFVGGAVRTARVVALVAAVPIGGFYLGFGSGTLRFVVPLVLVGVAPAPRLPLKMRWMVVGLVGAVGYAVMVATGLIPYGRILFAAKPATMIGLVWIGSVLGWRRTAPALGLAVAAGAVVVAAVLLQRSNLQPAAWLLVAVLAATQIPLGDQRSSSIPPTATHN
jgi:hypothetical protein